MPVEPETAAAEVEIHCPLCGYDLRGLPLARCPECGRAFDLEELRNADRHRHPYLFEHGDGQNVRTFLRTWFWSAFPRQFWVDLKPVHRVRPWRLLAFFLIGSLILLVYAIEQFGERLWHGYSISREAQRSWSGSFLNGVPTGNLYRPVDANGRPLPPSFESSRYYYSATQSNWPMPTELEFWSQAWNGFSIADVLNDPLNQISGIALITWPVLTLITLLLCLRSMRQAKVKIGHLFRAVVYSSKVGLIAMVAYAVIFWIFTDKNHYQLRYSLWHFNLPNGHILLWLFACFAALTAYRLQFALSRYLQMRHAVAVAILTQLICFLTVSVAVVPFVDFSRTI